MERKALLGLRKPTWVKVFPKDDLEAELVASEMPDLSTSKILGVTPEGLAKDICEQAFVGFRCYTDDDGVEIENTLETRRELYSSPAVRIAINNHMEKLNIAAISGEGDGGSD